MDGSVDSLGAIDNSYIFEYIDQLVAPAVPFVLIPCCLFTCCLLTCCCCFFISLLAPVSASRAFDNQSSIDGILTTRSLIEP